MNENRLLCLSGSGLSGCDPYGIPKVQATVTWDFDGAWKDQANYLRSPAGNGMASAVQFWNISQSSPGFTKSPQVYVDTTYPLDDQITGYGVLRSDSVGGETNPFIVERYAEYGNPNRSGLPFTDFVEYSLKFGCSGLFDPMYLFKANLNREGARYVGLQVYLEDIMELSGSYTAKLVGRTVANIDSHGEMRSSPIALGDFLPDVASSQITFSVGSHSVRIHHGSQRVSVDFQPRTVGDVCRGSVLEILKPVSLSSAPINYTFLENLSIGNTVIV